MKRFRFTALVAAVAMLSTIGVAALPGVTRDRKANSLKADLNGFEEVPSISSTS